MVGHLWGRGSGLGGVGGERERRAQGFGDLPAQRRPVVAGFDVFMVDFEFDADIDVRPEASAQPLQRVWQRTATISL